MAKRIWEEIYATKRGLSDYEFIILVDTAKKIFNATKYKIFQREHDEYLSFLYQEAMIYTYKWDASKETNFKKYLTVSLSNRAKTFRRDIYAHTYKNSLVDESAPCDDNFKEDNSVFEADENFYELEEDKIVVKEFIRSLAPLPQKIVKQLMSGMTFKDVFTYHGFSKNKLRNILDEVITDAMRAGFSVQYMATFEMYLNRQKKRGRL